MGREAVVAPRRNGRGAVLAAGRDCRALRMEFAEDTAAEFLRFALRWDPVLLDRYIEGRRQAYERWAG